MWRTSSFGATIRPRSSRMSGTAPWRATVRCSRSVTPSRMTPGSMATFSRSVQLSEGHALSVLKVGLFIFCADVRLLYSRSGSSVCVQGQTFSVLKSSCFPNRHSDVAIGFLVDAFGSKSWFIEMGVFFSTFVGFFIAKREKCWRKSFLMLPTANGNPNFVFLKILEQHGLLNGWFCAADSSVIKTDLCRISDCSTERRSRHQGAKALQRHVRS